MGIDAALLEQLDRLLRPLRTRIANITARAVVQLVSDASKLQALQIGALAGETIDGAEHHQPYGFSSVPLPGAEGVVLFPNGDREHPLVICASDRRHRPRDGEAGQVDLYHYTGSRVTMLASGNVVIKPGPGGKVLVDDGGGGTEELVKRSEFLSHGHPIVATGAVTPCAGPVTGALPAGSAATFPGTGLLQAK